MRPLKVTTVDDLVEALGGTAAAAKFFATKPQSISNWKRFKKLPAAKYLDQRKTLEARGIIAADSLWFGEAA